MGQTENFIEILMKFFSFKKQIIKRFLIKNNMYKIIEFVVREEHNWHKLNIIELKFLLKILIIFNISNSKIQLCLLALFFIYCFNFYIFFNTIKNDSQKFEDFQKNEKAFQTEP